MTSNSEDDGYEKDWFDIMGEAAMLLLLPRLVAPWWFIEWDQPRLRRFWLWWWIYPCYAVLTGMVFAGAILQGELWPLLLAPAAHVVAPLTFISEAVGLRVPGVGFGLAPDILILAFYAVLSVGVVGVPLTRRFAPELFGFDRPAYPRDPGEFVVPMKKRPITSDDQTMGLGDAPPVPKLRQDLSTAVIGETGSGKTTGMQLLATQYPYDEDTAVIVHESGDDFEQFYRERGFDVLRAGPRETDVRWNLFKDIHDDNDFREIANAVFGEPDGHDPFHNPAKNVFIACLRYLYREAEKEDAVDRLGHADIRRLVGEPQEQLYNRLRTYDDLRNKAEQIVPDGSQGSQNVYTKLTDTVESIFIAEFAEHGHLSIREYIENPSGRVLLLRSDPMATAADPMYQLLLTWTIRIARDSPTPTNFVLDEIDTLPAIPVLGDLAARGRDEGARALLGVQTVGQLEAVYQDDAAAVLGNCPQGLYFQPGDKETTQYIQAEVGKERQRTVSRSQSRSRGSSNESYQTTESRTVQTKDRHPFTASELTEMEAGECVVVSKQHWWKGKIKQPEEAAEQVREPMKSLGGRMKEWIKR